ncbi:MAG: hypothetical protein HPY54_10335 [Chthonomonadetes bacterium]|nr:hypothetical protein [Chthonomonadetes bacterium]
MRSRSSRFSFSSSKETVSAALILALLVGLFFVPALTGGRVWLPTRLLFWTYPYRAFTGETPPPWNPLMWDGAAQFGAWRLYTARMWREGWLPLWNPHQGMGYPLYANSQSAVFYPPNALFAWLGAGAFGWLAAWHVWWAGMGVWWLLRRDAGVGFVPALTGAVAFAFSLWMVTWQYLPTVPATASWLPWVLVACSAWCRSPDVHRATWWGATMGLCLLAGHLQIAFYVILASAIRVASLFSLWKGTLGIRLATLALAFAVALSLSAPQVLPAVELSRYSHRRAPATAEGYSAYVGSAMPLANLITLFLPDFFGHPSTASTDAPDVSTYWGKGNYAEFACFMGIPALLLAGLGAFAHRSAWRVYALILATLAMLLALGTPLNALLYFGVPGFSGTGSPARVLVLWAFGTALLAGLGAERLAEASRRQWLMTAAALLVLLAVGVLSARTMAGQSLGEEAFAELLGAQLPFLVQGVALTLLGAGAVLYGKRRGWKPAFSQGVLTLCVAGALWVVGTGYNPASPAQNVYPSTPLLQQLQTLTEGRWRIFAVQGGWSLYRAPQAILPPNLATAAGLYDLQIYDSLMPLHAKRWLDELNGRDSAPVENGNMALGWRAPADRLAEVGVKYVLSVQPLAEPGLKLLAEGAEGRLYEVMGTRPWVRTEDGRECTFRWQGCNRLEVLLPEETGSLHVLQTFAPGWKVEPAGKVEMLDGTFQRVQVAAGTQRVLLRYAPDLLRVCLYFALVAVGWCAGFLTATSQKWNNAIDRPEQ